MRKLSILNIHASTYGRVLKFGKYIFILDKISEENILEDNLGSHWSFYQFSFGKNNLIVIC